MANILSILNWQIKLDNTGHEMALPLFVLQDIDKILRDFDVD